MHRHAFADQAVLADDQLGRSALVLGVLRRGTNNGMMKDCRAFTDFRQALHDNMAHQAAVRADADCPSDMAEGSDVNVVTDDCSIFDNRCPVDCSAC